MSRQSRSVASSGASNSYSLSFRSPEAESYRQTFNAIFMSVRPLLREVLREPDVLVREHRPVGRPAGARMLHEVLVVARREVLRARVGAPALLARLARLEHARGEVEAVAELDRLREVGVEELALVLDDDALGVALAEALDDLDLVLHLVAVAEDAEVLEHRGAEVVADLERPLAVLHVEHRLDLRLPVALHAVRERHVRLRGERPLGGVAAGAATERNRLHQRVPTQAVRAVHGDAGSLAGGVQALELGAPVVVGLDAAHVVVRSGPNRHRLVDRIDTGERH